jgi:hypothetical protein
LGLEETQKKLEEVSKAATDRGLDKSKLIFVCQHISAERLIWPSSLVFCPHATKQNKFIAVPHVAVNYSSDEAQRDVLGSFMGSFDTHWTRSALSHVLSSEALPNFVIVDTGQWYYESPDQTRKDAYVKLLSTSQFTLCPRGTGPSTIRIWEVMASGSIPVVISDSLVMPDIVIPWSDIAVFVPEWMVFLIPEILASYTDKQVKSMSDRCQEAFYEYCSNDKLWGFIPRSIKSREAK